MIIPYSSEFFEDYLKFESDTMKEIYFFNNKDKKDMKLRDFIQVFKKIKSIREKNPIPLRMLQRRLRLVSQKLKSGWRLVTITNMKI